MTFDLDAIRARDAEDQHLDPRDGRVYQYAIQLIRDRRALLAEVDRLREENVWAKEVDEAAGRYASALSADIARAAERARIRAAVEGLRTWTDAYPPRVMVVDRAAVLAAIEGETT